MNDPVTEWTLDGADDQIVEKKEYVKPTVEEGAELPHATAQAFTPAILNGDLLSV